MPDSRVIPSLLYNDFIVQPLRGRGFSCWFRPGPGTPKKPRCCKTRSFSSLNFPLSFGDPTPAGNLEAMEVWHLGLLYAKGFVCPIFFNFEDHSQMKYCFSAIAFQNSFRGHMRSCHFFLAFCLLNQCWARAHLPDYCVNIFPK